jgi:hypothetical protein
MLSTTGISVKPLKISNNAVFDVGESGLFDLLAGVRCMD